MVIKTDLCNYTELLACMHGNRRHDIPKTWRISSATEVQDLPWTRPEVHRQGCQGQSVSGQGPLRNCRLRESLRERHCQRHC